MFRYEPLKIFHFLEINKRNAKNKLCFNWSDDHAARSSQSNNFLFSQTVSKGLCAKFYVHVLPRLVRSVPRIFFHSSANANKCFLFDLKQTCPVMQTDHAILM